MPPKLWCSHRLSSESGIRIPARGDVHSAYTHTMHKHIIPTIVITLCSIVLVRPPTQDFGQKKFQEEVRTV